MIVRIRGRRLPGRTFASDGELLDNVHVGVQIGREVLHLTRGDAPRAEWRVEIRPKVHDTGRLDFHGPDVHGKRVL